MELLEGTPVRDKVFDDLDHNGKLLKGYRHLYLLLDMVYGRGFTYQKSLLWNECEDTPESPVYVHLDVAGNITSAPLLDFMDSRLPLLFCYGIVIYEIWPKLISKYDQLSAYASQEKISWLMYRRSVRVGDYLDIKDWYLGSVFINNMSISDFYSMLYETQKIVPDSDSSNGKEEIIGPVGPLLTSSYTFCPAAVTFNLAKEPLDHISANYKVDVPSTVYCSLMFTSVGTFIVGDTMDMIILESFPTAHDLCYAVMTKVVLEKVSSTTLLSGDYDTHWESGPDDSDEDDGVHSVSTGSYHTTFSAFSEEDDDADFPAGWDSPYDPDAVAKSA